MFLASPRKAQGRAEDDSAPYLRARQIYAVTRLDHYTQPANIAAVLLLCVVAWGLVPTPWLILWAVAIIGVALVRMYTSWRGLRDGPPVSATPRDVRRLVWQSGLTSLLYSMLLIYLVPEVDERGLVIVSCVLTGMISAGGLALATIPQAVLAWVGFLCAGAFFTLVTQSKPQGWLLACFLGIYAIVITLCTTFVSRLFLTSEVNATRARARLVDAIESLSDGFLLWDRDRQPVLANTAGQRVLDDLKSMGLPSAVASTPEEPIEMQASDGRWLSVRVRETQEGGVVAISSDISGRRLAEATVIREANRYQTILKTASDGIHVIDENGYLVEASASFLRELRYPEKNPPRLNIADWDLHIKQEDVSRIIQKRMGFPPGIFEAQHRRSDGTVYDAEVSAQLVVFDGRKYLYCSARNVTDRKRAAEERIALERQLRQSLKMEAVGRLTGGVAHDFNNLLAVLLGRLQLIEEELGDNQTLREWTRACIRAVDRGATLTNSLLAFSRQQPLMPIEIDLNAIVGDMAEILKRTLGENIEVQVVNAPDLWHCEADPGQMQSALLNLVLNARDAMPKNGKLIVETKNARLDADYAAHHTDVKPGEFVMLAVSDTGTGMTPEVLEQVFDPFFTTKEIGKGSGLGLSMVHGFVNQSGGHINIYSEVGRGTVVRIYLPRVAGYGAISSGSKEADRAITPGHETIILVEDNDDLRAITQLQLKRLGYTVFGAEHAESGLILLREHPETSLLLTDIVLPGGTDGIQLAERARALRPTLEVIFMTGYTEHAALEGLNMNQPGRLLHKPFHVGVLASHIRGALDQK